jgi:predicted DNA-binding transcriptional regulator AlpA
MALSEVSSQPASGNGYGEPHEARLHGKHFEAGDEMSREGNEREEVFLTAAQVAKRYGMSRTWAYHCPELQSIRRKIGKRTIRWALSDIEKFERQDREKAVGGKPADLMALKEWEDEKRQKEIDSKVKFIIQ